MNDAAPIRPLPGSPIEVHIIETPGLGNRSYLATDGTVAVVIDPQRDIDRIFTITALLGVRLTHVFETHVHNDYVTGGLTLARQTGAEYVVAAAEDVAFERRGMAHGDTILTGALRVTAIATPGHTHHHLAYVVADAASGAVAGTFTGGSVLYGTVGRTDLAGPEHTDRLTRAQWRSAHRLVDAVPNSAAIWPTHGFGSFCSGGTGSGAVESTAGDERRSNPALILNEASFLAGFLAGLGPYPAYYRHMASLNRSGPAPLASTPLPSVGPAGLRRRIDAGEWVVDLRPRSRFAAGHLPGSVNVEGIAAVATYVGWVVTWGAPISLIGPDEATIAAVRQALGRIGIDPVAGHVVTDGSAVNPFDSAAYPVRTFADLAAAVTAGRPLTILDVRAGDEWREGHLPGAVHIPWHDLRSRLGELPAGRDIWVHCAAGLRAAIAASLLQRADLRPVLVDDRWWQVYDTGLAVEEAA
ncbi:MAG TPA: MBL fold metallo-hydrolase [Acidimicrobiia bacterium]|nr:MBL fold metallo-hydrolase [Acidimicrobiia bacterium]